MGVVRVRYYGGEHGNMKFSLVAVAVILAVLISSCEGQKGGAKSAMRNRGRGGSGRGRSSMGRNNYGDSGSRGQDDIFGNVDPIHSELIKIQKYKIQVMEPGERPVSDCASSENFKENR